MSDKETQLGVSWPLDSLSGSLIPDFATLQELKNKLSFPNVSISAFTRPGRHLCLFLSARCFCRLWGLLSPALHSHPPGRGNTMTQGSLS